MYEENYPNDCFGGLGKNWIQLKIADLFSDDEVFYSYTYKLKKIFYFWNSSWKSNFVTIWNIIKL